MLFYVITYDCVRGPSILINPAMWFVLFLSDASIPLVVTYWEPYGVPSIGEPGCCCGDRGVFV